jgi:hypothetical protein
MGSGIERPGGMVVVSTLRPNEKEKKGVSMNDAMRYVRTEIMQGMAVRCSVLVHRVARNNNVGKLLACWAFSILIIIVVVVADGDGGSA